MRYFCVLPSFVARRAIGGCLSLLAAALLAAAPVPARADCEPAREIARQRPQEAAPEAAPPKGTLTLRVDNDLFGGVGQDWGYSNGFVVNWASPSWRPGDDECGAPGLRRAAVAALSGLHPSRYDRRRLVLGLGQGIFTPADKKATELIADDRPFAGALLMSVALNTRSGASFDSTQFKFGIVGPSARAKEVQDWWHGVIGNERFEGWGHQLRDEPVFQLLHERRQRLSRSRFDGGLATDLIGYWSGAVGNLATYAAVGGEWRLGWGLPDDHGSAPARMSGDHGWPSEGDGAGRSWNGHFFAAVEGRWVLRDITLDGNTFKTSHRVDKRPFVADLGLGVAVYRGDWRLAFVRYFRTREFDGQVDRPIYGSFTISTRF